MITNRLAFEAVLTARRDPRVDVLRGLALVMIFIDHVPANVLGWLTLHVFSYADAAEVFVLFAGFASMLAYGKVMLRQGFAAGSRKIGARCVRLYSVQVLLFLLTLVAGSVWASQFGGTARADDLFAQLGWKGVGYGVGLYALPAYLDILPLYLLLLGAFPLMFVGLRNRPRLTLGVSVAVWAAAAWLPGVDMPNWLDPHGWYFDPFSWQLIFLIGAGLGLMLARNGTLPSRPWLTALCVAYLVLGASQSFPFVSWGLPDLRPFGEALPTPDKTHLGLLRILGALAWVQVIFRDGAGTSWVRNPVARSMEWCGRHSLPVFATGCALALVGRLAMATFGEGPLMQVAVNLVGISTLVVLGWRLDHPTPSVAGRHRDMRAVWDAIRTHQPRG